MNLDQWKWKTNTKMRQFGLFTRFDRIKASICALSVFLSVGATLGGALDRVEMISIYFITIGVWICFDPVGAFVYHFATITRYLILFTDCMVVMALWIDAIEFRIFTGGVFFILLLYIYCINGTRLRSENLEYSEAVQHAKINDPENETGEAYQYWGMAQIRALYMDLGLLTDPKTIDTWAKPVFYLTYFASKTKNQKLSAEVDKLKKKVASYEEQIEDLKNRNISLQNDADRFQEAAAERGIYYKEMERMHDELVALQAQYDKVVAANEFMASNPEQVIEVVENSSAPNTDYLFLTEEQRIFECFRLGMKNKEIEKAFNKPKSTVSDMKKRYLKSLEDN